jgi:hypothetical protein
MDGCPRQLFALAGFSGYQRLFGRWRGKIRREEPQATTTGDGRRGFDRPFRYKFCIFDPFRLLRAEYLVLAIMCNPGFFSVYLLCLCKTVPSRSTYLLVWPSTSILQLRHGFNGWSDEPFLLSLIIQQRRYSLLSIEAKDRTLQNLQIYANDLKWSQLGR